MLILAAIVASICSLLSTAPFDSGLASIASISLLVLIAIYAKTSRIAIVIVFATQLPLWLWLHRWIGDISIFGLVILGLYLSAWPTLFVYLLRRHYYNECFRRVSIVIVAPIIWVGLECLRGIILFEGYPWYLAGTSIVDWNMAQIASIGSVWSASFLVVLYGTAFARYRETSKITWIVLGLVFLVLTIYGASTRKNVKPYLPIAVVQTNVTPDTKIAWTWEQQQEDVEKAIKLTYEAIEKSPQKPHLIVWPETMLPGGGFSVNQFDFAPWSDVLVPYWYWAQVILSLSEEIDIPILIGTQTLLDVKVVEEGTHLRVEHSEQYNSAALVFPDGLVERYDKIFLTPFGERMPYVEHWPALQEWIRKLSGTAMLFDLDSGKESKSFSIPGFKDGKTQSDVTFGTPICFEDTVPKVVRDIVWDSGIRKVELLINLSNDGWFGKANDARLQHIREARMRCIENRTPMLRVANTGLSCYIDSKGEVTQYALAGNNKAFKQSTEMFTKAMAGFQLPSSRYIGDSVAWVSLIACILLVMTTFKKRSKDYDESVS